MIVTINQDYYLPSTFSDVTLKEFIAINDFVEKRKIDDLNDEQKLDYYISFIELFGINRNDLKHVKLYSNKQDELGIINLFNHLFQFTQMPEEENLTEFDSFEFNGVTYGFNKNSVSLTGSVRPMTDYTYEEFEEANSVLTSMNMVSEGKLEHLSLLCAIFFRPLKRKGLKKVIEPYNSENVKQRADLFLELTMDKVFSAYFFLLKQISLYNVDIANSLLKEAKEAIL